jgi:hypothetical protein
LLIDCYLQVLRLSTFTSILALIPALILTLRVLGIDTDFKTFRYGHAYWILTLILTLILALVT